MRILLKAGSTIGILGGGQLGRMLAMAAAQMGYRCHIFAPEEHSVAADVSAAFTQAQFHDTKALAAFADSCDIITYEFENVPVGPLAALDETKLAPTPRALEIAQDRLTEKTFVSDLGGAPAPFAAVANAADLGEAIASIGAPGILKLRRDGYDGKGQWRIHAGDDVPLKDFPEKGLVYEALVDFACEFSVILVRGRDGEMRFWDTPQNIHKDGILACSRLPAPAIVAEQTPMARKIAGKVAQALDYVGVLTLEFFATSKGPVFNEMAPRVHNSGHWTIEGAVTSQFANHIRAIVGAPLGDTRPRAGTIVMENLIGASQFEADCGSAEQGCHVHLYGKAEARKGRKMGHRTCVG